MITGFFFYFTAFITALLLSGSVFFLFELLALGEETGESMVKAIGLLALFSASLVFFIFCLLL